jgi:epoxyqueuosine reductase
MYNDYINENLQKKGAAIIGFADLRGLPENVRHSFQYGIIIGISLNKKIVSNIPTGPHLEYYNEYKSANDKLNILCEYTAELIQAKGFNAFPQSKKNIKKDEKWRTPLPHKTVATLSGIGWIGKSAVLVTHNYGSAIRITSVLTDMPFITGEAIAKSLCGDCNICTESCPGKAVKGNNWNTEIDRDDLLDPGVCKQTAINRGKILGLTSATCGVCIAVCPHTRKYIKD